MRSRKHKHKIQSTNSSINNGPKRMIVKKQGEAKMIIVISIIGEHQEDSDQENRHTS